MRWEEQLHKVFDSIQYTKGSISIKGAFKLRITGIRGDTITYTVELDFVPKDMKLYTDFPGDYSTQLEAWYEYADNFMESKELTDRLQDQIMQRVNKVYGQRRNGFSISPVDDHYEIASGGDTTRQPLLFTKEYKGHLKIKITNGDTMSEKSLRKKIIRLAHSKPELRKHLLPLIAKKAQWNSRGQWVDETGKVVETYYMEGKYFGNGGEYFENFETKEDMIDTYKQISRYRGYKRQVSPNPKSIKMFVEYEDGDVKEIRKR
tara:strand:- start:27 stop:812 length:786 start_codon:yes stop_codon:yes gene_type:complete